MFSVPPAWGLASLLVAPESVLVLQAETISTSASSASAQRRSPDAVPLLDRDRPST